MELDEARHILGMIAGRESGMTTATMNRDAARVILDHLAEQGTEFGVRLTGGPDRLDPPEHIYRWPSLAMAEDQAALNPEFRAEYFRRRKAGPWVPVEQGDGS